VFQIGLKKKERKKKKKRKKKKQKKKKKRGRTHAIAEEIRAERKFLTGFQGHQNKEVKKKKQSGSQLMDRTLVFKKGSQSEGPSQRKGKNLKKKKCSTKRVTTFEASFSEISISGYKKGR